MARAHERGIHVVLDLVVNHTSSEHPWFVESRSSRDSAKRGYYIWRDGKGRAEPNNWDSAFGGPAWSLDEATGQWYLHCFAPEQPDLDWENPQVRDEIVRIMETWFARGIDGFRMDVIDMVSKMEGLPDLPAGPDGRASCLGGTCGGPHVHEYIHELHERSFARHDCVAIGECPGATAESAPLYTSTERGEVDMLFQFEHLNLDHDLAHGKWTERHMDLRDLKACLARWQEALHGRGWNALYLSNHDQPRVLSRLGSVEPGLREHAATCIATFLHLLQGTPCVFQGEEIGMANFPFSTVSQLRDVESRNAYAVMTGAGASPQEALRLIRPKCRDNARTPMQWSTEKNAGFTSGEPWMPVNPDYPQVNVAEQLGREDSVLAYYRRLIELRRDSTLTRVIADGSFELLAPDDAQTFSYLRDDGRRTLLVACNVSGEPARLDVPPDLRGRGCRQVIANHADRMICEFPAALSLRPYEALVLAR